MASQLRWLKRSTHNAESDGSNPSDATKRHKKIKVAQSKTESEVY